MPKICSEPKQPLASEPEEFIMPSPLEMDDLDLLRQLKEQIRAQDYLLNKRPAVLAEIAKLRAMLETGD
jgi:hypothetical protein